MPTRRKYLGYLGSSIAALSLAPAHVGAQEESEVAAITTRHTLAKQNPTGMGSAPESSDLWVSHTITEPESDNVFRLNTDGEFQFDGWIDPYSPGRYDFEDDTGPDIRGMAVDDEKLYFSYHGQFNEEGGEPGIYEWRLNENDTPLLYFSPPGTTLGLTYRDGELWAAAQGNSTIWKLDSNYNLTESISVPASYEGLAHSGETLWGTTGDEIHKVNPISGELELSVQTPGDIRGLTWSDGSLWGCDAQEGEVYQLNMPPVDLSVEYAPTQPNYTEEVKFDSEASDPDGEISETLWRFSDGVEETGGSVTRTFEEPGEYAVSVEVTDSEGGTTTQRQEFTVGNQPPQAEFQVDVENPTVGEEVSFQAEGSDPEGEISGFYWRFGDSVQGQGESVTHTYESEGEYTVSLRVVDEFEGMASVEQTIDVTREPTPTETEAPSTETETDSSSAEGGADGTEPGSGGTTDGPDDDETVTASESDGFGALTGVSAVAAAGAITLRRNLKEEDSE